MRSVISFLSVTCNNPLEKRLLEKPFFPAVSKEGFFYVIFSNKYLSYQ